MGKNNHFSGNPTHRRSFIATMFTGALSGLFLRKGIAGITLLQESVFPKFSSPEGPNNPMGTELGIVPGRVAWAHDPKAVLWNETSGNWWDEAANDQERIVTMVSKSVQSITNEPTDKKAWKALFADFNKNRGKGNKGYSKGEKVAIKINLNNDRTSYDDTPWINTSPQVIFAVVKGLVKESGVAEENITIFDAIRYVTPHMYDYIHKAFPGLKFVDGYGGLPGRIKSEWTSAKITYAVENKCGPGIATCATEADYLINIYTAKGHPATGVTLSAKNHYGSIDGRDHYYIKGAKMGYNQYNPLVEVMGHRDLGAKTLLYVCDMLYSCYHSDALPIKWKMAPFNNSWPASIFVSQDPIACDSVATDFLTAEFDARTDIPVGVNAKGKKVDMSNCDTFLHEAALAHNPPSKVVYAPNGDGVKMQSLGVHEHWNNVAEKKYSRNLGKNKGIELITI